MLIAHLIAIATGTGMSIAIYIIIRVTARGRALHGFRPCQAGVWMSMLAGIIFATLAFEH